MFAEFHVKIVCGLESARGDPSCVSITLDNRFRSRFYCLLYYYFTSRDHNIPRKIITFHENVFQE